MAEVHSAQPEQVEFDFARRQSGGRYSVYDQEEDVQSSNHHIPSRTNSDITNYGPIRRRSLLQPGIVTRKPVVGNDSRQSLPSQLKSSEKLQGLSYHQAKSNSSPLLDFAALTPPIPCSTPGQRVQTPNSQDYGHIGVFKLGSLRITNGAASPTPSDRTRPLTANGDNDYLTEGGEFRETHHPRLSQRSNTLVPADTVKSPWVTVRPASPLRQVQKPEKEPLKIETQLPLLDPSLALFDFRSKHSPTKSLELAQEYIDDLLLTPFSFDASPLSSAFQVTSKHTAMEDDLFEPEPGTPPPEAAEIDRMGARSYDSGYGSTDSPLASKAPKERLPPKPLAKADSGYSSNISLRSFNKKENAPMVPAKDPQMLISRDPVSRVASSTYSISSSSENTLSTERSLPSLPQRNSVSRNVSESSRNTQSTSPAPAPVTPQRQQPAVPSKNSNTSAKTPDARGPNVPPKTETRMENLAKQKHKRQQSLPTPAVQQPQLKNSPSGDLSRGRKDSQRGNKMQKRPQSMQPAHSAPIYTVQAMPSNDFSIPPVSKDAERKLEERVGGFPVASFPNTFSGLRKSSSKETLGTIFSVGSAEVREEINFARLQGKLPAVPSPISEVPPRKPEPKKESRPETNRRATIQPTSSSVPFWKTFDVRRKSLKARSREPSVAPKTAEQREEEFEAHVTSFETISSSLGKSPYDVAAVSTRPSSSGAAVRAKSLTEQFESDAAARFQRNRNISEQSQASTVLQNKHSYGSIKAGNPFASGKSSPSHSRVASRDKFPPQSHANRGSWRLNPPQVLQAPVSNPQGDGIPISARDMKQRKPPVSMQTQHKMQPRPRSQPNNHPAPSALPSPPERQAPQPAVEAAVEKETHDQWAAQKSFWAERRKSAGEALTTRKSMELGSRPGSTRPSIDAQRERMSQGMSIPRASSARPSNEVHQQGWGNSGGWNKLQQPQYEPWTGHSTGIHRNYSPQWQQQTLASYHHTYGNENPYPSQHEYYPQDEGEFYPQHNEGQYYPDTQEDYYSHQSYEEYYAQPDANTSQHQEQIVMNMHSRKNSTNGMMALEGWEFDVTSHGMTGTPQRIRA